MLIKEILIYKYGKWTEANFKGLSSFTHVQGKNEAGKSTLTSFILSILFGFSTKKDDRFKPISSTTLEVGGAILVESPQYGEVRIERLYGAKHATVSLDDGTVKGEDWLRTFLGGVDRTLYENIYFFDLDGLQNVHKIEPEDITRFLLSASTIGSEKLFQIENELSKKVDSLFKPQGKVPILNQQLGLLTDLDTKIKEKKKGIDQYNHLLHERQDHITKEIETEDELNKIQREIKIEKDWQTTAPLVLKEEQLFEKLNDYQGISFPENGLERWKEWTHALKPVMAQETSLQERINRAQAKLTTNELVLLKEKNKIETLLNQAPLLIHDLEVIAEHQTKLNQTEALLEDYKQQLGIVDLEDFRWTASAIKEAEILLEKHSNGYKRLEEKVQKERLEQQRHKISIEKIEQFEKETLPPHQLELEEGMIIEWETRDAIEKEKSSIQTEIALLKKEIEQSKQSQEKSGIIEKLMVGFICLLFIAAMGISIMQEQWLFSLLSGLLLVVIGFSYSYLKRNGSVKDHTSVRINLLENQLQQLEEKEKGLTCTQTRYLAAKERLQQHDKALEQLKSVQVSVHEQSWYVEELHKEKLEAEELVDSIRKQLENLFQSNTGKELNLERLSFELPIIQGIQQTMVEKEKLQLQLNQIEQRTKPIQNNLEAFATKLELSGSLNEKVLLLKQLLQSEQEQEQASKHQQELIDDLKIQLQKINTEKSLIQDELQKLLKQADVEDEDSYLKKGYQVIERDKLQKQIEAIQEQLRVSPFTQEQRNQHRKMEGHAESLTELEKRDRLLHEELEQTRKSKISLDYEIKQLEEGGTYTDLLHQFYQEKSTFIEIAKEWSVYTIAKGWLQRAMVQFKEGTFPLVLEHAERVFQTLTDENYKRISFSNEKQVLSVLDTSGRWYPVSALSQATKEQVYVAIRFGLIEALYPTLSLPIIIDDSFVNFDPNRVSKVMETLKQLSDRHQIIYLSCHPEMASYFPDEKVVQLWQFQPDSLQQKKTV